MYGFISFDFIVTSIICFCWEYHFPLGILFSVGNIIISLPNGTAQIPYLLQAMILYGLHKL